jgi:hypothetical protein
VLPQALRVLVPTTLSPAGSPPRPLSRLAAGRLWRVATGRGNA